MRRTSSDVPARFHALRISSTPNPAARIEEVTLADLPPGDVVVQVERSSLNYKDALSILGVPGVTKQYPHTPGIDAAGTVVSSSSESIHPGTGVIVGGGEFGVGSWGGLSEYVRVPAEKITALPPGMSPRTAMAYGTAGITAAACVEEISRAARATDDRTRTVLVTGATGGVGSIAVGILSRCGYRVCAATGKRDAADYLKSIGAAEVIDRDEILDTSPRPLLHARWDAVVDSVGGEYLAAAIRASAPGAVVTAVGNAAGAELPLTVYPFILRGVRLIGINSPALTSADRARLYSRLAGEWQLVELESVVQEYSLDAVPRLASELHAGKIRGRIVIEVGAGT